MLAEKIKRQIDRARIKRSREKRNAEKNWNLYTALISRLGNIDKRYIKVLKTKERISFSAFCVELADIYIPEKFSFLDIILCYLTARKEILKNFSKTIRELYSLGYDLDYLADIKEEQQKSDSCDGCVFLKEEKCNCPLRKKCYFSNVDGGWYEGIYFDSLVRKKNKACFRFVKTRDLNRNN